MVFIKSYKYLSINVLFIINHFGLHGSSISTLALINGLKKEGVKVHIIGENGELLNEFRRITNGLFLVPKSRYHHPTFTRLLLILLCHKKCYGAKLQSDPCSTLP